MCGIFGAYTSFKSGMPYHFQKALKDMAYAGQVRGRHGAGMFSIYPEKKDSKEMESTWVKSGGPIETLIKFKPTETFFNKVSASGIALVGHHRFATQGEHTTENAHPFNVDHITMVHNGFIQGMPDKGRPDSFYFTEKLAKAKENWRDVIKNMNGAYALAWFDANEQKLRFLRNDQRPLAFAETEWTGFLFASELPMLKWICDRNEVKVKDSYNITPGIIYSVDLLTGKIEKEDQPKKVWGGVEYNNWGSHRPSNTELQLQHHAQGMALQERLRENGKVTSLPHNSGAKRSGTKLLSHKTYQNIACGDHVLFSLFDVYKVGTNAQKQEQYHYEGALETINTNKSHWQVHFMLNENNLEFSTAPLLQGEVVNILASQFGEDVQVWVRGKSVETFVDGDKVPTQDMIEYVPPTLLEDSGEYSDQLTLFDGNHMSFKEWDKEAGKGCIECGNTMFKHNAEHCVSTKSGIVCQDCVENFMTSKGNVNAKH